MLEKRFLIILSALRQDNTVTDTARQLSISQPALSKAIQEIESQLGVKIYDRQKNVMTLNNTGVYASKLAASLLDSAESMEQKIRDYDRSRHQITIGGAAPGPALYLQSQLSSLPETDIIHVEIATEKELLQGLKDHYYHMILLSHPVKTSDYLNTFFADEVLEISLPVEHILSTKSVLCFNEINGLPFLVTKALGEWETLIKQRLPDSILLNHDSDQETSAQLIDQINIPAFSSTLGDIRFPAKKGRIHIPLSDPDAKKNFYLIMNTDYLQKALPSVSAFIEREILTQKTS